MQYRLTVDDTAQMLNLFRHIAQQRDGADLEAQIHIRAGYVIVTVIDTSVRHGPAWAGRSRTIGDAIREAIACMKEARNGG